jgi:hypothetical protein
LKDYTNLWPPALGLLEPNHTSTFPACHCDNGKESVRKVGKDGTHAEESSASSSEEGCSCIQHLWIAVAAKQQVSTGDSDYNLQGRSSKQTYTSRFLTFIVKEQGF